MSDQDASAAGPLGQIADEFVAAVRRGHAPSVEDFARPAARVAWPQAEQVLERLTVRARSQCRESFRDLQRHRLLTLEWQPLTPAHGYIQPAAIEEAGALAEWRAVMDRSADLYDDLAARVHHADARECKRHVDADIVLHGCLSAMLATGPSGHLRSNITLGDEHPSQHPLPLDQAHYRILV